MAKVASDGMEGTKGTSEKEGESDKTLFIQILTVVSTVAYVYAAVFWMWKWWGWLFSEHNDSPSMVETFGYTVDFLLFLVATRFYIQMVMGNHLNHKPAIYVRDRSVSASLRQQVTLNS